MNSWTGDTASSDDSEESEENAGGKFEERFMEAMSEERGRTKPSDIGELELVQNLDQVEHEGALKKAFIAYEGEKQNLVGKRMADLGISVSSGDSEENDESSDSGGDWTGDEDEEDSEESDSEAAEPSIESAEDIAGADEGSESESAQESSQSNSEGPPQFSDSFTPEEGAERDRRWKVMVWGPPKLFKTHFCYTMPEPIAFIDTEGKADDLAGKFSGKEIRIWQPKSMTAEPDTKFRRAKKALDQALEWLTWHWENNNQRGTIVVDSMTLMWEWAQVHHKIENYPLKDEEDIELSANFGSSQESDWAAIKEYHNGEFRERITDSPFHFCWTAMERVDFEETMDDDDNRQIMEPKGEPDNDYKIDTEIMARKDKDRGKVGDLIGSNYVDNSFVGLKRPTFPKVKSAIRKLEDAESSEQSVDASSLATDIEAEAIISYDPQVFTQ